MIKIMAVILTKNEARHISACIESVSWADQVLVVDSLSDDDTTKIAQEKGAMVTQHPFINFSINRNLALEDAAAAGAEWVFFIDADERASAALGAEIRTAVEEDAAGWWVPRHNSMWGHVMRGGGWYPDCQLRLLRLGYARYDSTREVHEIVQLDGPDGTLKEHLFHYNYDSLAHFHQKQNRYIDFEAQILFKQGIKPKPWTYITMPLREFKRRYFDLQGYRDDWRGLQVCSLMSWYIFLTYWRLRRLNQ